MKKFLFGLFIVVGLVLTGYGGYLYLTSDGKHAIIKTKAGKNPACIVHIYQHESKAENEHKQISK